MKRSTVAIDARWAVRKMSGIGQYILQLARRMPELCPEIRFVLLVDRPMDSGLIPAGCEQFVLGNFPGDGTPLARLYSPFWLNVEVPAFLAGHRVDLFHGANFVIPRFAPCRTVATLHDASFFRAPHVYGPIYRSYMRLQMRFSAGHAHGLIAISNRTRDDLMEMLGIRRQDVSVIHCGVDSAFREGHDGEYLRRTRSFLGLPERYLLHVGIVESKKNLCAVLEAAAPALRSGLLDAVVLAGRDGFGASSIRRASSTLGLAQKVRFLGFVSQEYLPGLYALASIFVFPSLYEGFGLPVLEAMASGVPTVSSRTSAIPEVVGDAALLVDPADTGSLGETITTLLTDLDLRERLVRHGRLRVRQFSWDRAAAEHVAVYRRTLDTSRPTRRHPGRALLDARRTTSTGIRRHA